MIVINKSQLLSRNIFMQPILEHANRAPLEGCIFRRDTGPFLPWMLVKAWIGLAASVRSFSRSKVFTIPSA